MQLSTLYDSWDWCVYNVREFCYLIWEKKEKKESNITLAQVNLKAAYKAAVNLPLNFQIQIYKQ